jgi:hypothetical protein
MAQAASAPTRRSSASSSASPRGARRRPVAVPARPAPAPRLGFAAAAVGTISSAADSGIVLGLTRSRLWIGVLATLLVGIVALNVMALSLNAGASQTAALSQDLSEANSALRADIAAGLSNEHLQNAAARIGLVMPQAASALMLTPGPGDAAEAARRLRRGDFQIGSAYAPPAPAPEAAPVAPVAEPDPAAVDPAAAGAVPAPAPFEPAATTSTEVAGGVTP